MPVYDPPSCPVMDPAVLNDLFRGDRSRVREWLGLYLEEAPRLFAVLEDARSRGDVEALVGAAHELRPLAHYLGAPRMLELLKAIGELIRSAGVDGCRPALDELMVLAGNIEHEVSDQLAREAGAGRTGGTTG